jgi:hypothetical protein
MTDLFFAGQIFLIAFFYHFLPALTRSDIFFAVTVAPDYRRTKEARRALRQFRISLWLCSFIALGIVLWGLETGHFRFVIVRGSERSTTSP